MTTVDARPQAWQRRLVLTLLGVSLCSGVIGNALTLVLLRESPVALLVVHASYPQMALASVRLDPLTFVAVAAVRRWLGEAVFFAAGRVIGTEVLAWCARRSGRELRLPHRLNHRYALVRDVVVLLLPHPLVSAFFGVTGMPWLRFLVLKLVGSVLTVAAFWYAAGFLPLEMAADFLEANAVAITMFGVVLALAWWRWQRRANGPDEGDVEGEAEAGSDVAGSEPRRDG